MANFPSPFLYPKTKHKRKHSPQYITNKSYKQVLRVEFNRQCIYCRQPEFFNLAVFGVEHYKPKEEFPDLEWEYANLFYACNCCNSRKGDSWPTETQLRNNVFVPNPCDHIMFEHLRFDGAKVEVRSEAGIYADELLEFNDDISVRFREIIISVIKKTINDLRLTKNTISKLEKKLQDKPLENEEIEIKNDITNLNNQILKLESNLIECGVPL